jgi:hypothetical protein
MLSARISLNQLSAWAAWVGFITGTAALVGFETARHPEYINQPGALAGYVPDVDTSWVGLASGHWTDEQLSWLHWLSWTGISLLLAAPLWWIRRTNGSRVARLPSPDTTASRSKVLLWIASLTLFALSVTGTFLVGRQFREMPPAYHDEYSYLFQAKTFLAGRLYFPTDERSSFFSQMHVLHDNGVFASRYFPGVGLWLAPWVAIGLPYWGQYLGGGLVVVLVLCIGYELPALGSDSRDNNLAWVERTARIATGVAAALACALSPGLLLFGNLLLSHHPTMLGLVGFVYCYLRSLRSATVGWPLAGGTALCLAMLCRPLTAFGFASPFAMHLAILAWHGRIPRAVPRLTAALGPIVLGVAGLAAYNARLTGNPFESPYGLYTKIYTPNHCYGFYNVTRGERQIGPKVLDNYNRWATDLTPSFAVRLLIERADASATWTLGRITTSWLAGVLLVLIWWLPVGWKLLVAAIAGVHAVYFPFGFEGIFGLSYVFETVPLLCLLGGGLGVYLVRNWAGRGQWGRLIWFLLLLAFNLNDPALRLIRGSSEIRFARQYYANFDKRIREAGVRAPALLLIRPDPDDRHRDLVTNSPSLDDPILHARAGDTSEMMELMKFYPDRQCWFYDANSDRLVRFQN